MAYKDLRGFIQRLEEEGEVQRVEQEVDWNLEAGAIIRRVNDIKAPAPFLQKIKGYPQGYSLFGSPVGPSRRPGRPYARLALALGLSPDLTAAQLIEEYIELSKREPIKPKLVASGPCQEEVHVGREVDVLRFPVPYIHGGDGGRYIGTWYTLVTKDPDTGVENWGMYRISVHDSYTLGIFFNVPWQDAAIHLAKCEARNKPLEFAMAIGTEPVTALISGTKIPHDQYTEAEFIGGLRGEPVEVVKCKTVDLEVPAGSEIVIEGEIPPHERRPEGPFGEFSGYAVTEVGPRPIMRIKAITQRRDPILPVVPMGTPTHDVTMMASIQASALLLDQLRAMRLPVQMVFRPPESSLQMLVVSTKVPYANFSKELGAIIWGQRFRPSYVVIVNDDIDVTDMTQVVWAICTRCHPDRGISKLTGLPGHVMNPALSTEERELGIGGASVLLDCTWPFHWKPEDISQVTSFQASWPPEVQSRVLQSWSQYGFTEP